MILLAGIIILSLTNSNIFEKALNAVAENNRSQKEQQDAMDDINALLARELPGETDEKDTEPGILETIDNDTYEINSIEDLVAFSNTVNDVNNGTTYVGKTVVLGKSLDFTSDDSYVNKDSITFGDYNGDGIQEGIKAELTKGRGFIPIGNPAIYNNSTGDISGNCFKGTFDGNDKSIQNILINDVNTCECLATGLFAISCGNIYDLSISGNITATNGTTSTTALISVGAIAGILSNAEIKNCNNICTIKQNQNVKTFVYMGGISGKSVSTSKITNCSNYGQFDIGGGRDTTCFGGISGRIEKKVTVYNCSNFANVVSNYSYTTSATYNFICMGGVVGINYGLVKHSYNIGNIANNGARSSTTIRTAGVVGTNYGNIISSYNKGTITSNGNYNSIGASIYNFAGGICGESSDDNDAEIYSYVINCYNVGNISATGASSNGAGGILGGANATDIAYCCYLKTTASKGCSNISDTMNCCSYKTEEEMISTEILQILGPDFMKDPNGSYPVFNTKYNYEVASVTNAPLTLEIDAKAGDLVVACIVATSDLTISSGWTTMGQTSSIHQDTTYQYLTYAYKKIETDGRVTITASQVNTSTQIQMTLIAMHDGGTPSILTEVERVGTSKITVTKPCDELVIWTVNTIWSGDTYKLRSNPVIPKISTLPGKPEYQRISNFIDNRASGNSIELINDHTTAQTHVSALKITPD